MVSEITRKAVLALVAADADATAEDRKAVADAMVGMDGSEEKSESLVISFSEAARRLGRRNPQFARNLAKSGKIKSVYGSGCGKRPYGVTARSVEEFADSVDICGESQSVRGGGPPRPQLTSGPLRPR